MPRASTTSPREIMPSHNEPCPRCPPFVVRCGHLGEGFLKINSWGAGGWYSVESWYEGENHWDANSWLTRAEADAEFERREEALLA